MRKEWLENIVSRGSVLIDKSVSGLPDEAKAELRLVDLDNSGGKYSISPPSRTLTAAVLLVALLLWTAGGASAYKLWLSGGHRTGVLMIIFLIVFFVFGLFAFIPAVRMWLKRMRRERYYLYCGENFIIERFPGRVTVIPESKIRYAFERHNTGKNRSGELYFDSIVYIRGGKEHLYDLQDHYFLHPEKRRSRHDNLYRIIRRKYSVAEPPANSPFFNQSF